MEVWRCAGAVQGREQRCKVRGDVEKRWMGGRRDAERGVDCGGMQSVGDGLNTSWIGGVWEADMCREHNTRERATRAHASVRVKGGVCLRGVVRMIGGRCKGKCV